MSVIYGRSLSLSVAICLCLCLPCLACSPTPTPHSVISYVVTQLCRGRLHHSKDHDPTLSIINRTLHLLPSASLLSPAFITVSTISSIFIVGDTVLVSIIGYAYTIFTTNRLTIHIGNYLSSAIMRDIIMNPRHKKDKIWGFCSYRFMKMGETSMAGGHMAIKQTQTWNISYTYSSNTGSVFWSHELECLGFTRITLIFPPLVALLCSLSPSFRPLMPLTAALSTCTVFVPDLRSSSTDVLPSVANTIQVVSLDRGFCFPPVVS